MKTLTYQKRVFNGILRLYNRYSNKLQRLLSEGINQRKQDILNRRLAKMQAQLQGLFNAIKATSATAALAGACIMILPQTAQSQTFATPLTSPFGLGNIGSYSNPSFADIDNDGDLDLLSGAENGNFFYFNNTGTATVPAFTALQLNPFGLSDVGYSSTPSFADLDNDGDLDMLSGEEYGSFVYFENTGTATSVAASSQQSTLVQVYPNPSLGIFNIINKAGTKNTYTLTDLAGKQVMSLQNAEKNITLNLSTLDKGVYFLNISSENASQTLKLMLQ